MICALHGFMGAPSDWEQFPLAVTAYDIYQHGAPSESLGLEQWAHCFNAQAPGSVLMGYSLGGRLALHALAASPQRWRAAVIVSAHPGEADGEVARNRLLSDEAWAAKFLTEPWVDLLHAWNAQPLFGGYHQYREEQSRQLMSDTLRYWSVGRQRCFYADLAELPLPVLWVVGEKDEAACSRMRLLRFRHPHSQIWIAEQAHHRVPWEKPIKFLEQVKKFLRDTGASDASD